MKSIGHWHNDTNSKSIPLARIDTHQIDEVESGNQNGTVVVLATAAASRSPIHSSIDVHLGVVIAAAVIGHASIVFSVIVIILSISIGSLLPAFDGDAKDGMRSGTAFVHAGTGHVAILLAGKQGGDQPLQIGHDGFVGIDKDTSSWILTNGQYVVVSAASVSGQQISYFLVVDFDEADSDEKHPIGGSGNVLKDVLGGHVKDAPGAIFGRSVNVSGTLHGIGFAAGGLSVGKDGAVESRHDAVDNVARGIVVDIFR